MAHDEASAGLLQELTDTHLADRAQLGEAIAFDELVRRHSGTVLVYATVVTADRPAARAVGARAFTDVLDQINSGDYSIDHPYLPGLVRSVRQLGLVEAGGRNTANVGMDRLLPERARSIRWLSSVAHFDDVGLSLALDEAADDVPSLIEEADGLLGTRAEVVDEFLAGLTATVPITFAADARDVWRGWAASIDASPTSADAGHRRLLPRIEPYATRLLQGAAALLLVAGAAGVVLGGGGGSSSDRDRGTRTGHEVAVARRAASDRERGAEGTYLGFTGKSAAELFRDSNLETSTDIPTLTGKSAAELFATTEAPSADSSSTDAPTPEPGGATPEGPASTPTASSSTNAQSDPSSGGSPGNGSASSAPPSTPGNPAPSPAVPGSPLGPVVPGPATPAPPAPTAPSTPGAPPTPTPPAANPPAPTPTPPAANPPAANPPAPTPTVPTATVPTPTVPAATVPAAVVPSPTSPAPNPIGGVVTAITGAVGTVTGGLDLGGR